MQRTIPISTQISLPVVRPFSLRQAIAFLRGFPPCQGDTLLTDDSITAAVVLEGRGVAFTIRGDQPRAGASGPSGPSASGEAPLTVEIPAQPGLSAPQIERSATAIRDRAAHLLGAADELAGFYAAAEGDPAFRPIVRRLYGLHHVRFLTLEEIAVYCVMMQRSPVAVASRLKRRFFDRFGVPVEIGGRVLRALPSFAELVELDGDAIGAAIGHARKGAQIAAVVRGVAALGEPFLREAPYADARDALLRIPGVGPFSAGAILLRGLGRMDELPPLPGLAGELREVYGSRFDEAALRRRYGAQVGYWAYYLKAGAARLREDQGALDQGAPVSAPAGAGAGGLVHRATRLVVPPARSPGRWVSDGAARSV